MAPCYYGPFPLLDSYALSAIKERLGRRPREPFPENPSSKRAAVAAILREGQGGSDAEILFIRRAEHPQDPWSGHMAFPGGRHEPADPTLLHTAIRETREEVGLDLEAHGTVLLQLPSVPATARARITDLTVTPFVFAVSRWETILADSEVAETIWAPLGPLARGETAETFDYEHAGVTYNLPSHRVGERTVWGLTYRMLHAFFDVLHA